MDMYGVLKENKKESEKKQEAPTTIWALSELCPSDVKVPTGWAITNASIIIRIRLIFSSSHADSSHNISDRDS
jgi:hypothetical protein